MLTPEELDKLEVKTKWITISMESFEKMRASAREAEQLHKDRDRLDWLDSTVIVPLWTYCKTDCRFWWKTPDGRFWEDVRAAIDAAMKADGGK